MRLIAGVWLGFAIVLGGCATPQPPPPETPLPNGVTRVTAVSTPELPGAAQAFSLYTHCGLDNAVIDFGGTLWDPVGYPGRFPNPPREVGNPIDQGTITVTGAGTAMFVAASGTRIDLEAHAGPKDVLVCY
jgi:hypothetical protein